MPFPQEWVFLSARPENIDLVEYKRSSLKTSKGTLTIISYNPITTAEGKATRNWHATYQHITHPGGSEEWKYLPPLDPIRIEDMKKIYTWESRLGPVYILEHPYGRFYGMFRDSFVVSTDSPESVAETLAQDDLCFSAPNLENISELCVPADLNEWKRLTSG